MVQINFARREVNVKVVYYGPGRSGKTTNLEIIHQKAPAGSIGEMMSIATETDRTLFFDFLPLDLGKVAGMTTKFQLYTVPGQVYYRATRKLVLQGADGVIFVADSQPEMMDENLQSLQDLEENLRENGFDINQLPLVLQWNKRDLENVLPVAELNAKLNRWNAPHHEAVAIKGDGVFTTLKSMAAMVIRKLNSEHGYGDGTGEEAPPPPPPAPPPPPPAAPAHQPSSRNAAQALAADLEAVASAAAAPPPPTPPPPPVPASIPIPEKKAVPVPPPAPRPGSGRLAAAAPEPVAAQPEPAIPATGKLPAAADLPPPPTPVKPKAAPAKKEKEPEEEAHGQSRKSKSAMVRAIRQERQREDEELRLRIKAESGKKGSGPEINPWLIVLLLVVLGAVGFLVWALLLR